MGAPPPQSPNCRTCGWQAGRCQSRAHEDVGVSVVLKHAGILGGEGLLPGMEVHPGKACSAELEGTWWGDEAALAVWHIPSS